MSTAIAASGGIGGISAKEKAASLTSSSSSSSSERLDVGGTEFIVQIFNNIASQLAFVEVELDVAASSTKIDEIKDLHKSIALLKSNAVEISTIASKMKEDVALVGAVNCQLKPAGATLKHVNKVGKLIQEIESEIANEGEFDYFRILAELYSNLVTETAPFECYGALPHIKLIQAKVLAIEAELGRQCQHHVREIGELVHGVADVNSNAPGPEVIVNQDTIGQLYFVVDVLGLEFRKDLCGRIAQLQLIPYEKAFKFGTNCGGLSYFERRFTWFRILLKVYQSKLGHIFPKKWCIPYYLFIEFSRRTKKHINDYLAFQLKEDNDMHEHVAAMLLSLTLLIAFESEMKTFFSNYIRGIDVDASILAMKEPMAEAFDPYLGPYIHIERETLEKLMEQLSNEEMKQMNSKDESNFDITIPQPALESSQKMFENIKASLKRCNTFSSGVTYLALSKEFRVCLHNYALSLKFRHPSPVSAKAGEKPIYEISKYMEVQLCRLIKTGEYCIETVPQLEEKMKEHIDEEFKDQISFTDETDVFQDMISETIVLINIGIMEKIYPLLGKQGMRAIDWSDKSNVGGDESQYMKKIFLLLNDTIPRIRLNLSTVYFQQFCMKLSATILDGYLENVMKLKRFGGEACNQLLLDLKSLEGYLINVSRVLLPEEQYDKYSISKVYLNTIAAKVKKVEVIFKLVSVEDSEFDELFKILWPDATVEDIKAVEALKLIKLRDVHKVIAGGMVDTVGELKGLMKGGGNAIIGAFTFGGGGGSKKESEKLQEKVLPTSGKGKFKFPDGSSYVGEYVNFKSEGIGSWRNAIGDVYDGQWKDGKFYGAGVYRYKTGDIFDGQYKDGKMVLGTYIYKSGPVAGNIYEGEWLNATMHGNGLYRINNGSSAGNTYEGTFDNGKFHGKGVYKFANGDVYEGDYCKGRKHGSGVLKVAATGKVIKQNYVNGKQK